jgi:uncharacterized protein YbjT (DUF2867 family)
MTSQNRDRVILVSGATGKQGGATARHLLQRGFRVRALTRSPDGAAAAALAQHGAEIVAADFDDHASVRRALDGAYGAYSVQNFWETGYQREIDQGIAFADAAKQAGVEHFVYSSVGSAHRNTGLAHFESKWRIEEHIRASGMPFTIFRPVWLMENWEGAFLRPYILSGTLALPLSPDVNFQQIAVDDVGAIAATAFDNREQWLGRALDIAGDEAAVADIVATFARVIGRPVTYQQVPWNEYRSAAGDEYHDMFRWFEDVGYNADVPTLRREFAALTSFEEYLRRAGWAGAQAREQESPMA